MGIFNRRTTAAPDERPEAAAAPDPGARPDDGRRHDRAQGPFDRSEVGDAQVAEMLDLGALLVSPLAGSELRLDVDADGRTLTGVTCTLGDAAIQLQAFAAPRSTGVWDSIRGEIADGLVDVGGTAQEHEGPLGAELHARMPARATDGRTTYTPVRFLGVDGPRWFLRGVLTGPAAVDEQAAAHLAEFLRTAVVDRGSDARAPRELLELTIPRELLEQGAGEQQPAGPGLDPFERGPEITELR